VIADIRDYERLKKEILSFQPDLIFHLAAQPIVRYSYDYPQETFEVNTLGTAKLLDALRFLQKPCAAVVITTDKVYENHETGELYAEQDKLGGYDPYSASKACAEIVVSSYRNSFFNNKQYEVHKKSISTARAGNVIGGGDWAQDRIIPDIIKALSNHKPVLVRNPESIRPWQHVLDSLSGYLVLAAKQLNDPSRFADAFNFGPQKNDCKKVKDLVESAISIWGSGSVNYPEKNPGYHEAALLRLDISKAANLLGWSPEYNSDTAILKTISWYKEFIGSGRKNARELVMRDIHDFAEGLY
jgi:CDP-glucose 4,6-dehydratase